MATEILSKLDRTAEARIANLRDSVRSHPADWNARSELGRALIEAGRAEEAVWQFREAQRAFGDGPLVHFHLGMALAAARRFSDAISAYRDAIDGAPDFAEAHNNLGAAYKIVGRLDDAVAAFDAARRIRPDWPVPHSNLAGVYEWQARHDDALACHRRAMALAPEDAQTHGNYLFTLLFHPDIDAQTLREAHREWENRHAQPLYRRADWRGVDCAHGRRLRIGYVSVWFRDHGVGRNLLPLLRRHDRTAIEVYCYAANAADDEVTGRMLALWSRVLAAAEHSRLLILSHEGSHREWARGVLGRHGVGASRVDFVDYQPRERYLALFNRIDISLDTLPYNGHTTSL